MSKRGVDIRIGTELMVCLFGLFVFFINSNSSNAQCAMNPVMDLSVCHGDVVSTIDFTGPTATTTYTWTNDNTTIGLVASGSGDITPFFALNGGTAAEIATIVVTPTSGGSLCDNDTFLITVNPIPDITPIPNYVFCAGHQSDIVFTSSTAGAVFDWTNDNVAIGLPASGMGNISFIPTNPGTTPIVANIEPVATAAGCENRNNNDFTITINPSPILDPIPDQIVCSGSQVNAVNFNSSLVGTTFDWVNDTPSIGLAASGSGDIASFTAVNTSSSVVVATVTVTPMATNGCQGPDSTFTITVNPIPQVDALSDQELCASATTNAVNFASTTTGTTFDWDNDTPSIGLSANGNGDIASFTTTNNTSSPITATITVTPNANGCPGPDSTFTITVNPNPQVDAILDQQLCASTATNTVNFTSATAGTTFNWVNDTPSIGLVANGTGDIVSFTATNTTSNPIIATITVTPTANGCQGPDSTFTITVNPTPQVDALSDQELCANTITNAVNFTSASAGTTFDWVNDTPSIGLVATGTGDIASFTALNSTPNPIVATITVTPFANGCQGPDSTFTITVNPIPQVDPLIDQTLCANTATNAANFTSATAGTTFDWVNDTPSIGLAANGTGDIASFTATNATSNPITATITVTPQGANGCIGPDSTFTITVNPTPQVDALTDQTVCANAATNAVNFTSATAGTTFDWVNDTPSIGLAANGTGDIASFTTINNTPNPITATITVTPNANGCIGPDSTFTITVNPIPQVDALTDQELCANASTNAVNFTSATAGTTFDWVNDTPSIGLLANGTGDIASFTATNSTPNPIIATITVTPIANGCQGPDSTFTITVNPTPQVDALTDQELCANTATNAVNITSATVGTTFDWVNDAPSIGLAANGTGDIVSFTAINNSPNPITATITVTPTANGCQGPDSTFTITVNPIPQVDALSDQELCANTLTNAVNFTSASAGTTFDWVNDTPSIGLAANGNGDIASFTALNTTPNPIVATITVTPTANGCQGPDSTFTITVNPIPQVDALTDQELCANASTNAVNFTSATAGTTFDWVNDTPSIGLSANGIGDIASFTAINAGSSVITATITVTPQGANGCQGPDSTFTITVNPTPQVDALSDQELCANASTNAVNFTSATAGTTFDWVNDTPSIGLVATGTGDIASFTALNSTPNPIVATITVTPFANGCQGPDSTFTITVNPIPQVDPLIDQTLCANTATNAANFTSATAGTTFDWVNDTPSIGLAANGTGDIASFTATNATSNPITATITVTPQGANGCIGPDSTFTITVNPTPQVDALVDQTVCANAATNAVNFTSATAGTTFDWVNDTPSIGLAANGTGDIASFTTINNTPNPITATITVTPNANGCIGPDSTFTITVNPIPQVDALTDQELCANASTNAVNFTSATAGTTFDWVNDTPSIGLLANGTGDIASFTATNSTPNPIIATITVTPIANGCQGPDSTFTITVNPTPQVDALTDQELCANTATNAVNFTSATVGTTFDWVNDAPSIGLAANGTGDIVSFTAINNSPNPITATITVTPTANGCQGPDSTFTITVNPIPQVDALSDQELCANTLTNAVNFTSASAGTTFDWVNDTPSIGLAANGNGDIASFTALNTTPNPIVATITVTPTANGCQGPDSTFTITVNPIPQVDALTDQELCANASTNAVNFTSATAGTTFDWVNDTPSIGLSANGIGDIASFTAINAGSSVITATITVTPQGANGCQGPDSTFTITVNPTPQVDALSDQELCANASTNAVNFTSATAGTTFDWVNDTPSIGLVATGTGDIASFTALNSTPNPIVATITVTPFANGCQGPDSTFTITVNPIPQVDPLIDQTLCANTATNAANFTSATAGTTFDWVNDTPSIGLAANGTGDIASFTATNATSNPITATITVTPQGANGCIGPDSTFTITVNPTPQVDALVDQTVCANTATNAVNFTSATAGTTFDWVNDTPSIGLAANGTGDIASFTTINNTPNPITATITVTPNANGCIGPDSTFTITVNPIPQVDALTDQELCANASTNAVNFTSATAGTTFDWVNDTPSIGLLANGTGDIASFTTINMSSIVVVATITITPTSNGCQGPDSTFTITVNPYPLVDALVDQTVCANTITNAVNFTSATVGTTFDWANDTPSIGLLANGSGDIASFTAINASSSIVVATITVTPHGVNGCTGPDSTFKITVNPTPKVDGLMDQELCANTATNAVNFTSATLGTTFDWVNDTPSIGLAANGNGNIASFVATNTSSNIITATITITPTANGCQGPDSTFTITVNPTPQVDALTDQTLCANTATTAVNFTSTTAGTSFDWVNDTPSIGLAANGIGDIVSFTAINATANLITAIITITPSANGCQGPDSTFTITVNPIPQIDLQVDQELCANTATNAINLTSATAGTTFDWVNDTPSIGLAANGNGDIASFTAVNTGASIVVATITITPTANGCQGPDSTITITVNPIPQVDALLDQELCNNTATNAVNFTSGTAGTTFAWANNTPSIGLAVNGTGNIASFTATNTTPNPIIATITVTPQGSNGCQGPDSTLTITVNPSPQADALTDLELCTNTTTNAVNFTSATTGTTFGWLNDTPSIGLAPNGTGNIPSFIAVNSASNPIIATITVTPTANGCQGPDSTFTITVNNLPTVDAGNDTLICFAQTLVLEGSGAQTYSWSGNVQNGVPFVPPASSVYYVTGTDVNGCENDDSIRVQIEQLPVIAFDVDHVSGCEPLEVVFTNNSVGESDLYNCAWDFGDNTTGTSCDTISHVYYEGSFDVTLTATSFNGCVNSLTLPNYINVEALPDAEFSASDWEITTLDPVVQFYNSSTGATTYSWDFGDGLSGSTEVNPEYTFENETGELYNVTLIAISNFGCIDSVTHMITLTEELIYYVPNAFTPNGDEFNNSFTPIFTSGFDPFDFNFEIYNRWGNLIWQSNDSSVGWDGTFGGNIVQDGVYTWKVSFSTTDTGKRVIDTGHVSVLK